MSEPLQERQRNPWSVCEACWRLGEYVAERRGTDEIRDVVDVYARSAERCRHSPEKQAGRRAKPCEACGRLTRHQKTGDCMACEEPAPLDWDASRENREPF